MDIEDQNGPLRMKSPTLTFNSTKSKNNVQPRTTTFRSRSNTQDLINNNNNNDNTNINISNNNFIDANINSADHINELNKSRRSPSVTAYTHKKTHSILSQISNHVRNLSIDSSNNINNKEKEEMPMLLLSPNVQQKGKISPENSPTHNKFQISSPIKVSGIAAWPEYSNATLEISDSVDINSFLHDNNISDGKIPNLTNNINNKDDRDRTKLKIGIQNPIKEEKGDDKGGDERERGENEDANESDGLFKKLYKHYPNLNIIITSILLWYVFSMTISVYNRWMFSNDNLNFKFPVIITSVHQLILTILSIVTLIIFPQFRLSNSSYRLPKEGEEAEKITYRMPIKEYITKILPCSIASAGDIGLGNTSFRFITLSLYTMVKTSSLIFVLLWGVFFKLEKFTLRIFSIVCIMTFGVAMMIFGQHDPNKPADVKPVDSEIKNKFIQFADKIPELIKRGKSTNLIFVGVSLVLLSACMSGLRWALTQMMLKRNKRTKNPILTMLYISPGMCISLFLVGLFVEGVQEFFKSEIWEIKGIGMTMVIILIPGFLAFFMTIAEYVLLQYASLLTLSIAGIFKELLTIFVSWVIFGDELSFINIIGLVITFGDIIWYNIYRFEENAKKTEGEMDNEFVDIEMNDININMNVK